MRLFNHQTIYLPNCVFPFDLSLSFGFPLPTYQLHVTTYLFTQIFSVESTYLPNQPPTYQLSMLYPLHSLRTHIILVRV